MAFISYNNMDLFNNLPFLHIMDQDRGIVSLYNTGIKVPDILTKFLKIYSQPFCLTYRLNSFLLQLNFLHMEFQLT
jgi:hypothetical protein